MRWRETTGAGPLTVQHPHGSSWEIGSSDKLVQVPVSESGPLIGCMFSGDLLESH